MPCCGAVVGCGDRVLCYRVAAAAMLLAVMCCALGQQQALPLLCSLRAARKKQAASLHHFLPLLFAAQACHSASASDSVRHAGAVTCHSGIFSSPLPTERSYLWPPAFSGPIPPDCLRTGPTPPPARRTSPSRCLGTSPPALCSSMWAVYHVHTKCMVCWRLECLWPRSSGSFADLVSAEGHCRLGLHGREAIRSTIPRSWPLGVAGRLAATAGIRCGDLRSAICSSPDNTVLSSANVGDRPRPGVQGQPAFKVRGRGGCWAGASIVRAH